MLRKLEERTREGNLIGGIRHTGDGSSDVDRYDMTRCRSLHDNSNEC